ncbi:MAG: glycoside hydrolase family 3 C-terminal domain-containing protein [Blautia sp.]|nr:glycoside hydrolase family 3 C-terminal domain-containing protein [Blautia sp.]
MKSHNHSRKLLSAVLCGVMISMSCRTAFADSGPKAETEQGKANEALALQMETESIVLAQNDSHLLPLAKDQKAAVFGTGQIVPNTGGSGSGAANGAYTTTLLDGMDEKGIPCVQELRDFYAGKISQQESVSAWGSSMVTVVDHGWDTEAEYPGEWGIPAYSGTGFNMSSGANTPEVKLDNGEVTDDGIVARAAEETDTAIIILTRNTGSEEMDRTAQPGDWYLDASERVLLDQVTDKFEKIVLVLSINGSIDMSWLDDYPIDTVLISYASGSQTGYAMTDLIYGYANPSARLADTITKTYEEHPTAETFGYHNYDEYGLDAVANNSYFGELGQTDPVGLYKEDIYEGYRYFDTFGKEVLYPFGSGLSYSDFSFEDMSVTLDAESKSAVVSATVKNVTQDDSIPAGKEVVEIYVSAPEGKLEQPYQKLVDFTKTQELAAGESETVSVSVPLADLASYDEEQAAYILEPGCYFFRVGSSSRDTHVAGAFKVDEEILVTQLHNELSMVEEDKDFYESVRLTSKDGAPITYEGEEEEMAAAGEAAFTVTAEDVETSSEAPVLEETVVETLPEDSPVYKFQAVQDGTISLPQFVSQMTRDELVMFCSGGSTAGVETYYSDDPAIRIDNINTKINQATSGAGASRSIERFSIPSIGYADGSAGISYAKTETVGDVNVGWSRAAAIVCCWNKDLLHAYGDAVGQEMSQINIDYWLAPSINLHRNPLNGRNNEYYSEDGVLSGWTAASVAEGVAEHGLSVCLKHFAGNNEEHYRRGIQNETTLENGTSLDAMNVIISERAFREIYLKPFEMAVRTGAVKNVMSAFNKVNGQYCATSKELLIDILRGEWGYDGYVVTDWGDLDTIADPDLEMAGGNDAIMSGTHVMYRIPDKIQAGLDNGTVTIEDLQRNAYHFLSSILASSLSDQAEMHQFNEELAIRTSVLPTARVNREYSEVKVNPLIATAGTSTYSFAVAEGSKDTLPEGLELKPDGTLCGKAAEGTQGTYEITFEVTDADGNTAEAVLPLTVEGELIIDTSGIGVAKLGEAFEAKLTAYDAQGSEVEGTYSTQSELPAGLSLSEDGIISGTLEAVGESPEITYYVTVDGKDGSAKAMLYCIEKDVELVTEALADAELDAEYASTLEAAGGIAPYTYKVKGLPDGFAPMGDQVLSGSLLFGLYYIPGIVPASSEGMYEVEVIVTDAIGAQGSGTVSLKVGDPQEIVGLAISTPSIPSGEANSTYEKTQFSAVNAEGDVTYQLAADSDELPYGLTLSEDGILEGSLSSDASGVYHLVIEVTDSTGTASKGYELFVKGRLDSDPVAYSTFHAAVGEEFTQTIEAQNGPFSTDYTYVLDEENGDALPEGLALSVNEFVAEISGTPAEGTEGTYHLLLTLDTATFAGNPVTSVVPYTLIVE